MFTCVLYLSTYDIITTYDIILCVYIQKVFHKIVSIEQAICAFFLHAYAHMYRVIHE